MTTARANEKSRRTVWIFYFKIAISTNNFWVNSADHEQQSGSHNADKRLKDTLILFLVAILPPVVNEWYAKIHDMEISNIWVQFMEPVTFPAR